MTDYEDLQLGLIAQTYRERGFTVRYRYRFRGEAYVFDAVARKGKREIVIIEIVNKGRNEAQRFIVPAIERIRDRLPTAVVDFRYIDVEAGALKTAIARGESLHNLSSTNALQRLTEKDFPFRKAIHEYLYFWLYYVDLIRAYALHPMPTGKQIVVDECIDSIHNIYNDLLRAGRLIPPEDTDDDVTMSLFDLYGSMQAAVQGASVSEGVLQQLRLHVESVRLQIIARLDAERRRG